MPSKQYWKPYLSLDVSALYRIQVQGNLDAAWSDRLAGMTITMSNEGDKKPVSILEGMVKDQAELVGVLNNLYEMHMPILSVEVLTSCCQ